MKTVNELERDAYMAGKPLSQEVLSLMEAGENLPRSVGDITAGFPEEDTLSEILKDLKALIASAHGNNKLLPGLRELLKKLDDKNTELVTSAEYGYSELNTLKRLLGI